MEDKKVKEKDIGFIAGKVKTLYTDNPAEEVRVVQEKDDEVLVCVIPNQQGEEGYKEYIVVSETVN